MNYLAALLAITITLFGLLVNVSAQTLGRASITPGKGGSVYIINSFGDVVTLSVPPYALHLETELSLSEAPTPSTSPILNLSIPALKIEPSGLLFIRDVTLEIRPTVEGRKLEKTTIFRYLPEQRIALLSTAQNPQHGISALMRTTSLYQGANISSADLVAISDLMPSPPEPQSARDVIETVFPLENFATLQERLGRSDLARKTRLGVQSKLLRDLPEIMDSVNPPEFCTFYLRSLIAISQLLETRLISGIEWTMEMAATQSENGAFSSDHFFRDAVATLKEGEDIPLIEQYGSSSDFVQLVELYERLLNRIEQIAHNCPPLRKWKVSIRREEKASMDPWGWYPGRLTSNLKGDLALLVNNRFSGVVSGEEKYELQGWGEGENGCLGGAYIPERSEFSIDGDFEEGAQIRITLLRKSLPRFKPACSYTSDASLPITSLLVRILNDGGYSTVWSIALDSFNFNLSDLGIHPSHSKTETKEVVMELTN